MTWLDAAIGWLDPAAGARRMAHRRTLDIHGRAYEAARRDNRTASWLASGSSANAEVAESETLVRARSRDLVRNNGYAQQIVETIADHVVGTGIVTAPIGLRGRNLTRVQALWSAWTEVCDFDGDQDLNGLLWSAVKGMAESGAALIRFRRQQFDASVSTVPLRLQLLEPDFIDARKQGPTPDGGWIDRGIEYDGQGRRIAYWLLPRHPGDVAGWRAINFVSDRVPADEVCYLFDKLRPGQDRGMPALAPAVMTLQDLRSYFAAELVRKRVAACQVGIITTQETNLQLGGTPDVKPTYGPQVQKFEPGMFSRLLPTEEITFNTPPTDAGVEQMAVQYLREAAAAGGVMYEHATGDFSRVNYSSWRAGHHGFRRRMERKQWGIAVHKACRPIAARWTEAARAAQLLPATPTGWRHTPPGFISVDPYKDAQADLANLRMGKVTLSQLVEERGYDYTEFLMQLAADLGLADSILPEGMMFDGDPRKVLGTGTPNAEASGKAKTEAGEA